MPHHSASFCVKVGLPLLWHQWLDLETPFDIFYFIKTMLQFSFRMNINFRQQFLEQTNIGESINYNWVLKMPKRLYGHDSIVLLVIFWKLKAIEMDSKGFQSELNQTSPRQHKKGMIFLFKRSAFPFQNLDQQQI